MKKALSCILSFLPTIIIFLGMIVLILITGLENSGYTIGTALTVLRILMLFVAMSGFVLGFVLMIVYIVKTFKNPNLSTGMKVLWCLLLFYLSVFFYGILPVYWFVCIRHEYDSH